MIVMVVDEINGNRSFYSGVKTIRYGRAYNSIVFYDGKVINFHNMIYSVYCSDMEE